MLWPVRPLALHAGIGSSDAKTVSSRASAGCFLLWAVLNAVRVAMREANRSCKRSTQVSCGLDNGLNRDSEVLVQRFRWSGLSKAVDPNDAALPAHIFAPQIGMGGFDGDRRQTGWQNEVLIGLVLPIKYSAAGH